MRVLLDTHIIIWALLDSENLSADARKMIEGASQIYVSSASIWEMSIKMGLGKLEVDLDEVIHELHRMGVTELPVSWAHCNQLKQLPDHHRDPFDRMLISQAMSEPLALITHDKTLSLYSDLVRLV